MNGSVTIEELAERANACFGSFRFDSPWMHRGLLLIKLSNLKDLDIQDFLEIQSRLDSLRGVIRREEIKNPVDRKYNHRVRRMSVDLMLLCLEAMTADTDVEFSHLKRTAISTEEALTAEYLRWNALKGEDHSAELSDRFDALINKASEKEVEVLQ